MDRLLIVDGCNLLFQMFFGMPARIVNKQGRAIQGTLGFVGAMLKIIRRMEPTHVIAIFDGEHENSRRELDSGYKANRPDYSAVCEEENPFSQLPDVYIALDYLKIKYTETVDCEADDMIASYVLSSGENTEIIIASFDSDFFQLITDRVSVLRYRGEKTVVCTPEYIMQRYGITPKQYADWKSLVGDTADNIKGAESIGAKTAAALLREFGSLPRILFYAEKIKKPSVRESVIRNAEKLGTNYRMIQLSNCTALPFDMQELKFHDSGITTNEVLKNIGLK